MVILLGFLLFLAVAGCLTLTVLWLRQHLAAVRSEVELEKARVQAQEQRDRLNADLKQLREEVSNLSKWRSVADADAKASELLSRARVELDQAQSDARILVENAERQYAELLERAKIEAEGCTAEARISARQMTDEASRSLMVATRRASEITALANQQADAIAGTAMDVARSADRYREIAKAMRNVIKGYGDEYLKPAESLLDDLAEEFSHKDAGRQLRLAREHTKALIQEDMASTCDYVDPARRERAKAFILESFNGKVDSILSRVKHDNHGTLDREIRDAFAIANHGGRAFRGAQITDAYLGARLEELRWAATVQEIKRQEREEQRRIREQMREEERARREYERAMREAAKEEKMLREAMAKAQAQIAAATEEQRALYETQLEELTLKLKEAEDRNQRAISMAQQTRRGHVYIISNVGSFGEDIYKIGLTRRLEPLDRVRELSDASVPFEFDVHAIILSDDAPALETQLHKHFLLNQLNKVNHRKEFFRARLSDIRAEIDGLGIEAKWTMVAEAREYRETIAIERAIESDSAARDAWVNRQLTLDPISHAELAINGSFADGDVDGK